MVYKVHRVLAKASFKASQFFEQLQPSSRLLQNNSSSINMQFFIVLAAFVAVALARPQHYVDVTQDTLGNYKLGYDIGSIRRSEERSGLDGSVHGSYSYHDANGILRSVAYTSGVNGFQVTGSHLPAPVVDVPEVAIARNNHYLALQRAGSLDIPVAHAIPVFGGIPETAEVAAARAEHLRIHAAARAATIGHF